MFYKYDGLDWNFLGDRGAEVGTIFSFNGWLVNVGRLFSPGDNGGKSNEFLPGEANGGLPYEPLPGELSEESYEPYSETPEFQPKVIGGEEETFDWKKIVVPVVAGIIVVLIARKI